MAGAAFETLADTRPRIRRDVLCTETSGGVLFHTADGDVHLTGRGRAAYRCATQLLPRFDGRNRLAELCAGLGEAQRATVAELVSCLLERELARDHRPTPEGEGAAVAAPLPAAVAERFAPQIEYADHYVDDGERRFARYRATRVAVLGAGEVADRCARSLLRNGAAAIGAEAATGARVAGEAAELIAAGCPVEIAVVAGDAFPAAWETYDVVVLTGADTAPHLHALLAAGTPEGRTLLPMWTHGDRAMVGPRATAGSTGCWSCALLRLGAARDAAGAAALRREAAAGERPTDAPDATAPDAPAPDALRGPAAAMVGNLLAHEVFRIATGVPPSETDSQVQIQDLVSLDVTVEPAHRHPDCGSCPPPARRAVAAAGGPAVAPVSTAPSSRDTERVAADLLGHLRAADRGRSR
ncbi:TOMM precursor leader peptide-binding protein [Streptomyces bohaiensis]|uniref:TOMM precursor leader peptide-binding protein n=1 Tax=Streptomyces bohaiensis TaxID=1431344 RepID=UPI003B766A25